MSKAMTKRAKGKKESVSEWVREIESEREGNVKIVHKEENLTIRTFSKEYFVEYKRRIFSLLD